MAEISQPRPAPSRTGAVVWLIVSQLAALISLVFWLTLVGLSVMAFDSGSPGVGLWALLIALWGYPLLPLGCAIAAWVSYRRDRVRNALILTTIPVVVPLLALLFLGL